MSLRQTAQEAEMDPAHLSRVERGRAQLSVRAAARLAGVLEIRDLGWLFGLKDPKRR